MRGPLQSPHAGPTVLAVPLEVELVGGALAGLNYPAESWQIVVTAELAGADIVTLYHLTQLPSGSYLSLAHIQRALAHDVTPLATDPEPALPTTGQHPIGPSASTDR